MYGQVTIRLVSFCPVQQDRAGLSSTSFAIVSTVAHSVHYMTGKTALQKSQSQSGNIVLLLLAAAGNDGFKVFVPTCATVNGPSPSSTVTVHVSVDCRNGDTMGTDGR